MNQVITGDRVALVPAGFYPDWPSRWFELNVQFGRVVQILGPKPKCWIVDREDKQGKVIEHVELDYEPTPVYRYLARVRPPYPDCRPRENALRFTGWYPQQDYPLLESVQFRAWGWVEYGQPLDFYQAWKADLWPENTFERITFRLWDIFERETDSVISYLSGYFELATRPGAIKLRGDFTMDLVKILLDEGYTQERVFEHLVLRTKEAK